MFLWETLEIKFCQASTFLCEWSPNYKPEHYKPVLIEQEPGRTKELLCSVINSELYSFYPLLEQFFPIRYLPGVQTVAQRGQVFSPISKTTWRFRKCFVWNVCPVSWVRSPFSHRCAKQDALCHWKWQTGQCLIGRVSMCKGEFQFERVNMRNGCNGEAVAMFFS